MREPSRQRRSYFPIGKFNGTSRRGDYPWGATVGGLMLAFLLAAATATTAETESARVLSPAPIYLKPDPTRTPLTTAPVGMSLSILAREGEWCRVVFRDQLSERTGYVEARNIDVVSVASSPDRTTAKASTSSSRPTEHVSHESPTPMSPVVSPSSSVVPAPVNTISENSSALGTLNADAVAQALIVGGRSHGGEQGLQLLDSGQLWAAALSASSSGATASSGFSVRAYTPIAWVRQLAADASKEYRRLSAEDLSPDQTELVFRVFVDPDTPNTVTARGMVGTSSVQHVVLRDESRRVVVQPISKNSVSQEVANAMGGRATFQGVVAEFAMDDLREVRGKSGEFFITVIGTTGEEKNFKVKKKHLDRLP